jgi:hypothetical protein
VKNRVWLLLFAVVVLIVALLLWRRPIQHTVVAPPTTQATVQTTNLSVGNTNIAVQNIPTTSPPVGAKPPGQYDFLRQPEMLLKYDETHNIPIKIYGQVIDQNSNPVPDVKINVTIQQLHANPNAPLWTDSKGIPVKAQTGEDGRFVIHGTKGSYLHIDSVQKDGYRLSPKTENIYGYGDVINPHHPDSKTPVIIKMWKLGKPQQLIHHYLSGIGIPVDGQPVQFDLVNGQKVSSGGQLVARLRRNPQVLPPRYGRYDWSLELEIPNGGLVANNDEFMYLAPENGYQETFKFDMPKDADNWTTAINQQLYIALENGKCFGSLIVRLNTIHDTPPLGINLDIVINPNGSRSLQP